MTWRKTIAGLTVAISLSFGAAPVIDVPDRQWVGYSTTNEKGEELCYDEFRRKNDNIKKEISCDFYFQRAHTKGFPNPVKLGAEELGRGAKVSVAGLALRAITPEAEAAVAYDSETDTAVSAANTFSFSHTVPASGSLVVATYNTDSTAQDRLTNACTYDSEDMFYAGNVDANNFALYLFGLHNPSEGANTVYCEFNDASGATPSAAAALAATVTGADLNLPIEVFASGSGNSAEASLTITTRTNQALVFDFLITGEAGTSDIIAGGDLHTERAELGASLEEFNFGTAGNVTPAGATTTLWSWTGTEVWITAGVSLRPPCGDEGDRCTEVITALGTTTWARPTGVTSADIACWGAGGGGEQGATTGSGGGGGGAYASSTAVDVSGSTLEFYIAASSSPETTGANSQFYNGTTYSPIACGGAGTATITGAAGGTTACSVGTAEEFAGGAGGDGNDLSDSGGGGGGAGYPASTGGAGVAGSSVGGDGGRSFVNQGGGAGNGANSAPGIASLFGGSGGGGGDNGTRGNNGGLPGGGGGGGESAAGDGWGARGMCQISYIVPSAGGGGAVGAFLKAIFFDTDF